MRTERDFAAAAPMSGWLRAAAFLHRYNMVVTVMVLKMTQTHLMTHFVWGREACAA